MLPDRVIDWDGGSGGAIFVLVAQDGTGSYRPAQQERWVERLSPEGDKQVVVEHIPERIERIHIAPGKRRMILERSFRSSSVIPKGPLEDMTQTEKLALGDARGGGVLVWDLEQGISVGSIERGYGGRWLGDDHILHVQGESLLMYSLGARESEIVLDVESTGRWRGEIGVVDGSGDGHVALLRVGSRETCLLGLDFARRKYAIYPGAAGTAVVTGPE